MVDTFLDEMDRRSVQVLQSQSYAKMQVLDVNTTCADQSFASPTKLRRSPLKKAASFASPSKSTSPLKENNSPLKKMGSLRKQSRLAEQENQQSPQKAGPSPQKQQARSKMFQKSSTSDEYMLKSFGEAPMKSSPLKRQMRLFESPESP